MGIEKSLLDSCYALTIAPSGLNAPSCWFGFLRNNAGLSYNQAWLQDACRLVMEMRGWAPQDKATRTRVRASLKSEISGVTADGFKTGVGGHETNSSTYDVLSGLAMASLYCTAAKTNDELVSDLHLWWLLKLASWQAMKTPDGHIVGPGARSKVEFNQGRDLGYRVCQGHHVDLKPASINRRGQYMALVMQKAWDEGKWTATPQSQNLSKVKLAWPIMVERYADGFAAWMPFVRSWDTPIPAVVCRGAIEVVHAPIEQGRWYPVPQGADPQGNSLAGPGVGGDTVTRRVRGGLEIDWHGRASKASEPFFVRHSIGLPDQVVETIKIGF